MKQNQNGLTLIEMMIAMIIGLLVVGTVITIFITNVRSNRDNVAMIKLNQELRGVMTFISDDLKRAGYSALTTNSDFVNDFNITANCIRYAYDEDADGTRDATERFGFRLDGNQIEWANNNTTTSCGDTDADWEAITDTDILNVTSFIIGNQTVTAGTTDIEQLTITITAQTSISGGDVALRTITEVIRVRNDDA